MLFSWQPAAFKALIIFNMGKQSQSDAVLLDAIKDGFGLDTDSQVASFLKISAVTIHHVRHGRARLGIVQRLKVLDKIAFLNTRQWLERITPDNLSSAIRDSSHKLARKAASGCPSSSSDASPDAVLLVLAKDLFGVRTDAELAEHLGVARNTISMVRTGRSTLGPKPRLRILHAISPFDIEKLENILDSSEALIDEIARAKSRRLDSETNPKDTLL